MTVRLEMVCDLCGQLLDGVRPFTIVHRPINDPERPYKTHDVCERARFNYRLMQSQHDLWCHLQNCDKGPQNPFERRSQNG